MKKLILLIFFLGVSFSLTIINLSPNSSSTDNLINKTHKLNKGFNSLDLYKKIEYNQFLRIYKDDLESLISQKRKIKLEIKEMLTLLKKGEVNETVRKKAIKLALDFIYIDSLIRSVQCKNGEKWFDLALKAEKAKTFKQLKFLFKLYLDYKRKC